MNMCSYINIWGRVQNPYWLVLDLYDIAFWVNDVIAHFFCICIHTYNLCKVTVTWYMCQMWLYTYVCTYASKLDCVTQFECRKINLLKKLLLMKSEYNVNYNLSFFLFTVWTSVEWVIFVKVAHFNILTLIYIDEYVWHALSFSMPIPDICIYFYSCLHRSTLV